MWEGAEYCNGYNWLPKSECIYTPNMSTQASSRLQLTGPLLVA